MKPFKVMYDTGLSKDKEAVQKAFDLACTNWDLKKSVKSKGDDFEKWILNTNYENCDEVSDFLTHDCKVLTYVSNGKIIFRPNF